MRTKKQFILLASLLTVVFFSCKKNNLGPPLMIVTPHEDIFYSRDTTDPKAYQMHITYNSNGSVDILRNEVGAVHASIAYNLIAAGIQTAVKPDTATVFLMAGKSYWLVPFLPGAPAVSVAAADTLLYTSACNSASPSPAQLITVINNSPQPNVISVNPHGCASGSVMIKTHGGNFTFNGGSVLVIASAVNIKK